MSHARPNLLVIMSDQHSPHVMGCAGDPVVLTPNLDRLAAGGVMFNACYTPSPLCAPARASFLTSRYPSDIEVWSHNCVLPSDIPTFAHSLGAAGYETVMCGRMHFNGPDQLHGFEKRLVGDLGGPFFGGGIPSMNEELLLGASGRKPVAVSGSGRTAYQLFDEAVTEAAADYLKTRTDERPLCMVVGYVLPHCPNICPPDDFEYYYDHVTLPAIPEGYFDSAHPSTRVFRDWADGAVATEEQIRCARAGYYGLVTHMDRLIGRVLEALDESGRAQDTAVIYTSDHGDMLGDHGLWTKMNYFEGSVRVPTIASWPGRFPRGARVSQMANLVDIGPTVIDVAGAQPLTDVSGRSLLPIINCDSSEWVNETYSELGPFPGLPPSRMIRRNNWKLAHYDGLPPMLFDLDTDQEEFHDLAADPACAHIVAGLTARVTSGWNPDRVREIMSRRERAYPLRRAWYKRRPALPIRPVDPARGGE